MTLQECKDQVAKIKGADDWEEWISDCMNKQLYRTIRLSHDEAAELYAKSQVNEALGAVDQLIRTGRGADIEYKSWLSGQIEKLKSGLPSKGGMKTN